VLEGDSIFYIPTRFFNTAQIFHNNLMTGKSHCQPQRIARAN
jgi:hypothetical protein